LEPVEDLQGALVSGERNPSRHSIKDRPEMFECFWHAIPCQQQLGKVRRSLQFKEGGGLALRPVDGR
jgi:hypothetical protein